MLIFFSLLFCIQFAVGFSNLAEVNGEQHNDGVMFNFRITAYSNPLSTYPKGDGCFRTSGADRSSSHRYCIVKFYIQYIMSDDQLQFETRDYSFHQSDEGIFQYSQDVCIWNFTRHFKKPPVAIFIRTENEQCRLKPNGTTEEATELADRFWISLKNMSSLASGWQGWQKVYYNKFKSLHSESSITTSLSMTCLGPLVGQLCDMKCTTVFDTAKAHCVSMETGNFSICDRLENGQVDECKNIHWEGNKEQHQEGIEWKIMAIGFLLLSVILAILLTCMLSRQADDKKKNSISIHNELLTIKTDQ